MEPLVSIIIPSYNYARYLPSTLDSVLNQDFQNYEIVLVDDGSSDESPLISEKYAKKDSRIRYKRRDVNKGVFATTAEAIDLARGTYIHLFSADDLYLPGCLSKFVEQFTQNPHAGLICSNMSYFQDGSAEMDVKPLLKSAHKPRFYSPPELTSLFLETEFWIPGFACMARKDLILKYEGHTPALENISDWFLFHRIALFEGALYIPENLLAMRVHDQTYTRQVKRNKKRRRATYWSLLKHLEKKRETKEKFKEAALLAFVFKELSWKARLNPKYWGYLPYIHQKNQTSRSST